MNFERAFKELEAANRAAADGPFFDVNAFPWVRQVEGRWAGIRAELDGLLQRVDGLPAFQEIQPDQSDITADDRWKVFPFYAYGLPYAPNLRRCPETAAALDLIPGMTSAMFSVLRGPKKIPPHRGPFNGVLRYHLGLRVPGDPERCRIRVGTEWRSWVEGKSLVFDDTFDHEVVDDLDGPRVVLFVDFVRPGPAELMRKNGEMVKAIGTTPYIQDVLRNLDRWNVDFELNA